jgi:hypothetical protein
MTKFFFKNLITGDESWIHLKGRHFGTVDNIQKVTEHLRALPHEDFQHCYREWEQRLQWFVASQGNYFEGDNVDL